MHARTRRRGAVVAVIIIIIIIIVIIIMLLLWEKRWVPAGSNDGEGGGRRAHLRVAGACQRMFLGGAGDPRKNDGGREGGTVLCVRVWRQKAPAARASKFGAAWSLERGWGRSAPKAMQGQGSDGGCRCVGCVMCARRGGEADGAS